MKNISSKVNTKLSTKVHFIILNVIESKILGTCNNKIFEISPKLNLGEINLE